MTTGESLSANYQRAFGKRIGFGVRPALIMSDFVQAYFEPSCAMYAGVEGALASALRLQGGARRNAIPFIYTNVVYDRQGSKGGRFYQESMALHSGCWGPKAPQTRRRSICLVSPNSTR